MSFLILQKNFVNLPIMSHLPHLIKYRLIINLLCFRQCLNKLWDYMEPTSEILVHKRACTNNHCIEPWLKIMNCHETLEPLYIDLYVIITVIVKAVMFLLPLIVSFLEIGYYLNLNVVNPSSLIFQ